MAISHDSRLARAAARAVLPSSEFVPFDEADVERSLAERFEKQVDRHPDRIAVQGPTARLTYRELNCNVRHRSPAPWTPQRIKRFLLNPPWRIWDNLLANSPQHMLRRLRVKLGSIGRRMMGAVGLVSPAQSQPSIADFFDLGRIGDRYRRLLETNFRACRSYEPTPYAGPIAVFRSRARGLFHPHDPYLGWRDLAQGGLRVIHLPGTHDNILVEPYVQSLAGELRACIEGAHARASLPESLASGVTGTLGLEACHR